MGVGVSGIGVFVDAGGIGVDMEGIGVGVEGIFVIVTTGIPVMFMEEPVVSPNTFVVLPKAATLVSEANITSVDVLSDGNTLNDADAINPVPFWGCAASLPNDNVIDPPPACPDLRTTGKN